MKHFILIGFLSLGLIFGCKKDSTSSNDDDKNNSFTSLNVKWLTNRMEPRSSVKVPPFIMVGVSDMNKKFHRVTLCYTLSSTV